jgi:Phage integrase, N-terminal SAM-like domain
MQRFKAFLLSKGLVPEKKLVYYLAWIFQFYAFCQKKLGEDVSADEIDCYLKHLTKSREEWQVDQPNEAIQLYSYFCKRRPQCGSKRDMDSNTPWKAVAEEMVKMLRLKHRSLSTERTYLGWLRSFYFFVEGKSPDELDSSHVKEFLTYLAVERRVASATQNQAFNAILFLFRHVLNRDIEDLQGVMRAPQKRRLPVVLTKQEILRLFDHLRGTYLLMAQFIYGCGLRLREYTAPLGTET